MSCTGATAAESEMNILSDDKLEHVSALLNDGASIRQVCLATGVAHGTVHRLQKYIRCADIAIHGFTCVLTGRKADGSFSYYETKELQPQWRKQHYGDERDFE